MNLKLVVAALFALTHIGLAQTTPVISEFMAANLLTLLDEDREDSDWIEIHNPLNSSIDLGGWSLTDNSALPKKWIFPAPTIVQAGGFLIVFASKKNRAVAGKQLHTNFKLTTGGEYLGLANPSGLIVSDYGAKYPEQFQDTSYGYAFLPLLTNTRGYLGRATPGTGNGLLTALLSKVTHTPSTLKTSTDCVVTGKLENPNKSIVLSVNMRYLVGFGSESTVAMRDDGVPPDLVANDDLWTAKISSSSYSPGNVVRWRIETSILGGALSRSPRFVSWTQSPQYFGAMVEDPNLTAKVPIFHWWTANPSASETRSGTRCSVYYRGEFYDNVYVRNRGGSSTGYPKQSHKFDFNKGDHFRFDPMEPRVEEINLNTTYADKAYMRQVLCYETYRDAGGASSATYPIRQQRNGAFYQLSIFIEQVDEDLLERLGLDGDGALYKVYNTLDSYSTSRNEKKTRLYEGWNDLKALVNGLAFGGQKYLWDHIDLPAVINYWAATVLIHDNDCVHKNYYVYRDTNGDRRWRMLPWDKDLTLGRNYTRSGGVLNDTIWYRNDPQSHPLFGDASHPKTDGFYNRLIHRMLSTPKIRRMYLRRLRTLMDKLLNESSTPVSQRYYESRIATLQALMAQDVAVDRARWGIPRYGDRTQDFNKAVDILKNTYLAGRRTHFFQTHSPGLIPNAQKLHGFSFGFGQIEVNPASNNIQEQFVEIVSCNPGTIDMTGWQLRGSGIQYTFRPGTVLDANGSIYVAADVSAFRNRSLSPKGGENRYFVGPFDGTLLSNLNLVLYDDRGFPVTTTGEFNYDLSSTGQGDVKIGVRGASPNNHLWILFSGDNSGVPGCGPFLGLGIDVLWQISMPLGAAPFHVRTNNLGEYNFSAPNNSLPLGTVLTSRAAYLDNQFRIVVSEVRRQKF
ncbi:MAG: CotH kinase family protein [Planctomycetota bacterium]|nr:CotH kinase family protein [Planctomycetota bacterium]